MSTLNGKNLVSIEECLEALEKKEESSSKIVFIDASSYFGPPDKARNARQEFLQGPRIKDSIYLDIVDLATTFDLFPEENPLKLKYMMPPKDLMQRFLVLYADIMDTNSCQIVLYGRRGLGTFLTRPWYMLKHTFGLPHVAILREPFEDWTNELYLNQDILQENDVPTAKQLLEMDIPEEKKSIDLKLKDPTNIVNLSQMWDFVKQQQQENDDDDVTIIDPRPGGFEKGHIPGAIHLPFPTLLDPEAAAKKTLYLLPPEELKKKFSDAGIENIDNDDKPIITSCGGGITVCHVLLALDEVYGRTKQVYMYDGSWSEWGAHPDTPKATGSD